MTTITTPPRRKIRLAINFRQYGILLALVVIIVLFQILTRGRLLLPGNVNNLIQQNAYVLILAIGMVVVIIAGHIDLSVGSVVAMVGAVSAIATNVWGMPWWHPSCSPSSSAPSWERGRDSGWRSSAYRRSL
jgi:putative multiple sugar transport system permease protein